MLYSARDMAVLRASLSSAQVVLASATPSPGKLGQCRGRQIPAGCVLAARFGAAELPEMRAIDMRERGPAGGPLDLGPAGGRGHGAAGGRASSRCCSSTAAATRR